MIEQTLRTFILADSTIGTLIGARYYSLRFPEVRTFPAIVYAKISGFREHDMDDSSIARPRFQLDCWAETYPGAKALANAVRERLDSYTGPVGSPADTVHFAYLLNEQDLYDDEPDPPLYRVSLDFEVVHNE